MMKKQLSILACIFSLWTCSIVVISTLGKKINNNNNNNGNSIILLNGTIKVQFKFFDNAFHFYNNNNNNQTLENFHYKLWKQNGRGGGGNDNGQQQWTNDGVLYSRLVPDQSQFKAQPSNGIAYRSDEFVAIVCDITKGEDEKTSFMLSAGTNVQQQEQQQWKAFIEPFKSYETMGYRNISLLEAKSNVVVGEVKIAYLVVRPITRFNASSEHGYVNTANITYVGHRGTGSGTRTDLPEQYIENTIAGFNYACSKGAQMIELDVQLSSDRIPIIYHDFSVKTYLEDRHSTLLNVSIEIPIKDLSYSTMQKMSTNFMPTSSLDPSNESFETLEQVLKQLNASCGINVEIKYPQLYENQLYEDSLGIELNEYLDRIIEVLYTYAGERKIFITSFHSDVCTMIQWKQNKYRVGFLESGNTKEYAPKQLLYYDPRTVSLEAGVAFAQSINLFGLSLLVDDIDYKQEHVNYVRSRNLSLYLWGDHIDSYSRVQNFLHLGVNGLIMNKVDLILANNH